MAEQEQTEAGRDTAKRRKPYHEQVASRLVEQLKQGTPPWRKPWKLNYDPRPTNPVSGKPYRGINNMFLTMSGYADPRWMTFNQARDLGYTVRKGEHGMPVQYWKWHEEMPRLDDEGKPVIGTDGKPVTVRRELERPKVFYSTVFNAEQMDGVPPLPEQPLEWNPVERAEELLSQAGVPLHNDGVDRAYYRRADDTIHLPKREAFGDEADYYGTALHELAHATGHESRLNREFGPFGSEAYAREELVAEIASMMLGQELRLDPRHEDNTAAYVSSWIKLLSDHPLEVLRAAAAAEKVKEYVMQREREQSMEQDQKEKTRSKVVNRRRRFLSAESGSIFSFPTRTRRRRRRWGQSGTAPTASAAPGIFRRGWIPRRFRSGSSGTMNGWCSIGSGRRRRSRIRPVSCVSRCRTGRRMRRSPLAHATAPTISAGTPSPATPTSRACRSAGHLRRRRTGHCRSRG